MESLEAKKLDLSRAGSPCYELPPVIILGGECNALSVVRDLGRMGVTVYAMGESDSSVVWSRYCRWIDVEIENGDIEGSWARYLLGPASEHLKGAVVLACSDSGIQVLIKNRLALLQRFLLDESDPTSQLLMLDKLTTYEHGRAAGVPTPRFWKTSSRDEVLALRESLIFPLMVKPRLSHLFEEKFGRKHIIVDSFDQLITAFDSASGAGMDMLLMEHIPGGDDRLCSYYTYLNESGEPQFHFTKRIIRRYPAGMGTACYHITDWIPELAELGNKLFKAVGLRGLANVEFKQDPRDGQYKLIECNARFTASNCLVSASGFSLACFVYNRIVGRPGMAMEKYKIGLRLWDPIRDWKAFRELRRTGAISFGKWFAGVMRRQTFPYFTWTDPMPAMARALKPVRRLFKGKKKPAAVTCAKAAGKGALA
jgi:predicted ATP-grasp superfamily ATP-dependent carboligase